MTVHRGKPLTAVGRTAWLAAGTAVLCLLGGAVTLTGAAAAQVTAGVLIALTGAAALLALRGRLTAERACLLLLAAGILLRITYALYTGYGERQHDVWLVTSGKGHMAYIQYIAEHLSLPDTNRTWQFYHPPLHHILAGLLYRLLTACGAAAETAAEKLQLLTAFYSGAALIVSDRIAVRCGLQGAGRVTALAFLAFHPTGLLLAGSLNNDTLLWLLSLLTLLWLLRWQEAPTVSNSVWMAVWLGLSMMAKTSGVLLAPAIAFAFCRLLWRAAARCPCGRSSGGCCCSAPSRSRSACGIPCATCCGSDSRSFTCRASRTWDSMSGTCPFPTACGAFRGSSSPLRIRA